MRTLTRNLTVVILSLIILSPVAAIAIPQLGVAPTPGTGGIYYGPFEDYKAFFVDKFVLLPDRDPGFFSPTGALTVWAGYQGKEPKWWDEYHVWLFTNSAAGSDFTFNGEDFQPIQNKLPKRSGNIDGYGNTFYGVDLGKPTEDPWKNAPSDSPFAGKENRQFRFLEVQLENFSGFNVNTDWLFAVVGDISSNPGITNLLDFSPKTTSSSATPEPATLLLLGSGLMGMGVFGRNKLLKK